MFLLSPDDGADNSLWLQFSSERTETAAVATSDSEEDEAERVPNKPEDEERKKEQ